MVQSNITHHIERPPVERSEKLTSIYKHVPEITAEDITKFFTLKNVRSECFSCQANDWNLFSPAREGVTHFPIRAATEDPHHNMIGGRGVDSIVMICHNCGYIRHHAVLPIATWKWEESQK